MYVKELWRYPVKSSGGERVEESWGNSASLAID